MASPHEPGHVMAEAEGSKNLTGGWKRSLHPYQGNRIILTGVFPGNVMQASGGDRGGDLAGVIGVYMLYNELLVVPQECGDVIQVLRGGKLDDPVTFNVFHVHDEKAKPLVHFRRKHQPGTVHGIGKGQIEGQVVRSGIGFVCGKKQETLIRSFLYLHFCYRRPHPLDISGEGVF